MSVLPVETEKAMTTQAKTGAAAEAAKGNAVRAAAAGAQPTKKAQLIRMLKRKGGADVSAISEKFCWLPHTTRAALTGLRKAGYEITSEKAGAGRASRYRITADPAPVDG